MENYVIKKVKINSNLGLKKYLICNFFLLLMPKSISLEENLSYSFVVKFSFVFNICVKI
jgi:hypothetical protein